MKTFLRSLFLAGLALSSFVAAFAGPGIQHWQTLRNEAQLKELTAGERIAMVCTLCKTVTEQTVSLPDSLKLAQEGAPVECPACHAVSKVTMKGPARNPSIQREVVYVNEQGQEILFVAKLASGK